MILSVSRRTDIPAFYSDWFFKQLDQGFVLVPNPIAHEKIAKIALKLLKIESVETNLLGEKKVETSGNIEGIVFWTKNPKPMLNKMEKLKDFAFYFLYTLNAYPKKIEANLPPLEERIESFKILSKYCPVIWRYDPIRAVIKIYTNLVFGKKIKFYLQFQKLLVKMEFKLKRVPKAITQNVVLFQANALTAKFLRSF